MNYKSKKRAPVVPVRPQPRGPRPYDAPGRWQQILRWGTLSLGAALLAHWLTGDEPKTAEFARAAAPSSMLPLGFEHLERAVEQYHRTWLVPERERLVQELKTQVEVLTPPMLWVLEKPNRPLFASVARLAGDLRVPDAAPLLREAAVNVASAATRVTLLGALECIEPLSTFELGDLLTAPESEVQLFALATASTRRPYPAALLEPALELLAAPHERVRKAALAALPDVLPPEAGRKLADLMLDEVSRESALIAMGRLEPSAETATLLVRELGYSSPETQRLLLERLTTIAAAESVQEVLWQQVNGHDDELRLAALRCLDRVQADAANLPSPSRTASWSPMARYFAARMRVEVGDDESVTVLLGLAGDDDAAPEAKAAAVAARSLLAALSGKPPHTPLDQFEELNRAGQFRLRRTSLPAAPPF